MSFDERPFIADLSTLVGFETIACQNPDAFAAARAWIRARFPSDATVIEAIPCGTVTSLLIRPANSTRPRLVMDGHIEVVPGSPDQFTLRQNDGWLYGRGAADMKTQCLVMIDALADAIARDAHHDTWLLLTEDEEVGSRHGLAIVLGVLQERGHMPPLVFAPDGGHDFAYVEKEKGMLQFDAVSRGQAAHASRPFLGANAIDPLWAAYRVLREAFPNPTAEADWRPSLSMTRVNAGEAYNRIPEVATAGFDLRFTEDWSLEAITDRVRSIVEAAGCELQTHGSGPATYYPKEAPVARWYLDLLEAAAGRPPAIMHANGASNGRLWVAADPAIQVLMSSPTIEGSHADGERVLLASIPRFDALTRSLIQALPDAPLG